MTEFNSIGHFQYSHLTKFISACTTVLVERSWVRFPPSAGLLALTIHSNVSLSMSLETVHHSCFSYENESLAVQLGPNQA